MTVDFYWGQVVVRSTVARSITNVKVEILHHVWLRSKDDRAGSLRNQCFQYNRPGCVGWFFGAQNKYCSKKNVEKNAQNVVVTKWIEWRKVRGRTGYPVGTVPSCTQRYPVVAKGTHLYNKCSQRSEIYIINVAHVPQIYIINVPHVPQNWRETSDLLRT